VGSILTGVQKKHLKCSRGNSECPLKQHKDSFEAYPISVSGHYRGFESRKGGFQRENYCNGVGSKICEKVYFRNWEFKNVGKFGWNFDSRFIVFRYCIPLTIMAP
jgi:hypothetical protein